jgi:hypothetical protein
MQEYISESIEPPTNPQFLNSSEHVKWSLHNLKNIRKRKFCIIFRGKYLKIHVQVPSWHPQQHICHLQKSEPSLYDSLANILHFTHIRRPVKKFQSFAEKIALFAHRAMSPPVALCGSAVLIVSLLELDNR